MAVRKILQLGDPRLRQRCEVVKDPRSEEVAQIIVDLAETVENSFATTGYGRAIAAPQIGEMKRIVYLSVPNPLVLINPQIVESSLETMEVWDACLSFLCIFMKVVRHKEIVVSYLDLNGNGHTLRVGSEHDLAELLQHEIDHLDGVLAIDKVSDLTSICTREEFENRYRHASPYAAQASVVNV